MTDETSKTEPSELAEPITTPPKAPPPPPPPADTGTIPTGEQPIPPPEPEVPADPVAIILAAVSQLNARDRQRLLTQLYPAVNQLLNAMQSGGQPQVATHAPQPKAAPIVRPRQWTVEFADGSTQPFDAPDRDSAIAKARQARPDTHPRRIGERMPPVVAGAPQPGAPRPPPAAQPAPLGSDQIPGPNPYSRVYKSGEVAPVKV